mgnify:CR=1 FL=1
MNEAGWKLRWPSPASLAGVDPTAGVEAPADVNPMIRPRASMGAAAEAAAHAILADAKGATN